MECGWGLSEETAGGFEAAFHVLFVGLETSDDGVLTVEDGGDFLETGGEES